MKTVMERWRYKSEHSGTDPFTLPPGQPAQVSHSRAGQRAARDSLWLRPDPAPPRVKAQFDVWRCNFPAKGGEHPAILISHPDICARAAGIETQRRKEPQRFAERAFPTTK